MKIILFVVHFRLLLPAPSATAVRVDCRHNTHDYVHILYADSESPPILSIHVNELTQNSLLRIVKAHIDGCNSSKFLRSSARRFFLEILVRGTKLEIACKYLLFSKIFIVFWFCF